VQSAPSNTAKNEISLLDFDFDEAPAQTTLQAPSQLHQTLSAPETQQEEDEFSEFTQAGSVQPAVNDNNLISFDNLLSQQQQQPQPQPTHQSQQHFNQHQYGSYDGFRATNMNLHHPFNPHIAQHNLVYQGHYQHQGYARSNFQSLPGHQQVYGTVPGVSPQGSFW
jgi:hypothetical protein